jgi:hypothetical protein
MSNNNADKSFADGGRREAQAREADRAFGPGKAAHHQAIEDKTYGQTLVPVKDVKKK